MKTIQISDELHTKLKNYCEAQSKIISKYVEQILSEKLKSEEQGLLSDNE